MPLIPQSDIVQRFTGPFSRATQGQLLNPDLVAVDTAGYMGQLRNAADLGAVLAIVDGLTALVDGWSPVLALAVDGDRRVLQITDWVGGGGTKPAIGFIAASGIVPLIANGLDVRGIPGLQGPQGGFIIQIYQNALDTTPPASPTGGTYDLPTRVLTPPVGWTIAATTPGAGDATFIAQAMIDPAAQSGSVVPTWGVPFEGGAHGPIGPQGNSIWLGFSTDGITFHAALDSADTYLRFAQAETRPAETATTWTSGVKFVGTDGVSGASVQYIYQAGVVTPAAATAGVTLDAGRLINAAPAPWQIAPFVPVAGSRLWAQRITVTGLGAVLYGAVAPFSGLDGIDGNPGARGTSTQYVYHNGATAPTAGTAGAVAANGVLTTAPTDGGPWFLPAVLPILAVGQRTYVQALIVTGETGVSYGGVTALTGEGFYVSSAALSLNATSQLLLTLGRTGGLGNVVSSPLTLPAGGLSTIASDSAFGGVGSVGDPLTLAVGGSDFPIITLAKGGLGAMHSNVAGVRTTLGLGSAALASVGASAGNLPALLTGGLLDPARLAASGSPGDVLARTSSGQEWATLSQMGTDTNDYVDTAALAVNSNDQLTVTLGRTGTLADITSAALDLPVPVRLSSVVSYDAPNTRINVTVNSLNGGTIDLPPRGFLFFALPSGLPTDTTTFDISINGQTPRGYYNPAGDLIAGSSLTSGRWTSIVRIGDRYYTADNVEAQDAFVGVAYAARHLTFTEAGGGTFGLPLDTSVFHGTAGVPGHSESFISNVTFQFGDYAAAANRLFIEARTTGGTVGPSAIATSDGFLRLPLLDAVNVVDDSALAVDTPVAGDVLTWGSSGRVWAPASPVGGDGTVTGVTFGLTANRLTVSVASTQGGPFTAAEDLSVLTLSAVNIVSDQFVSDRVGSGPAAGEFLKTDGSASSWLEIVAADVHGGSAREFLRSNGTVGAWAAISPTDLVTAGGNDGQILGLASGALAFLSPSGIIGVDTVDAGTGLDVNQTTGDVIVSLESQYQGRQLGIAAAPNIQISLNQYLITLSIAGVPQSAYNVGDTFTFSVPTPVPNVGTDTTPLSLLPGTTGSHFNIVSPRDGSRLTRADLVPGALHTLRYTSAGAFALVEPDVSLAPGAGIDVTTVAGVTSVAVEFQYLGRHLGTASPGFLLSASNYVVHLSIVGVPQIAYAVGDTFTFPVPDPITNVGTSASPLSLLPGVTGSHIDIVSATDGARLTRADLTAGALHTVRWNGSEFALVEPVVGSGGGSVTVLGNRRSYVIPASGVTGTVDDIVITTGSAISMADGDELYFTPTAGNTGAVTIAVDGNPAIALMIARNQGLRALKVGDLLIAPGFATYQLSDDRFLWRPATGSTAQYYEVGVGNFDLAILGPQGIFDPNRLGGGTTPAAGQFLAWASGGALWADLPTGGGTITGITTAVGSGLAGGALTGTPVLTFDFGNLASLTTSSLHTLDEFVMRDESVATLPYRRINLGNLVAHMAAATGSGLADSNGQLSIADDAITEPRLSVTNSAFTVGQLLSAATGGRFTWIDAPTIPTVPVLGTRRQWFVLDALVTGLGNNITINPSDALLVALQDGDTFVFRANADIASSNSVNILIRQTSPAKTVQRSNGAGGFVNVGMGDWTAGDLVVVQYSLGLDRLIWLGGMAGTASTRNVGTTAGSVAVLNAAGLFDQGLLGTGGSASRVLTYGAAGSTWEDLPAGGLGTITRIRTQTDSGLAGGTLTGVATLTLDASNLSGYQGTPLATDTMIIYNANATPAATERITLSQLALLIGGGTGDITAITTAAGSGLTGGATSGAPALSLDIGNLAALTTSTIDTLDEFVIEDVSEASDPYRKMNLGNLVAHIAGATGSGLTSANGRMSLADAGILETKLDVTNDPTTGQFLAAAASGQFTWTDAPTGGAGVGANIFNAASLISTYDAANLRISFDVGQDPGNGDLIYFVGPTNISTTETQQVAILASTGGTGRLLYSDGNAIVAVNHITAGRLYGMTRVGTLYRLIEPLAEGDITGITTAATSGLTGGADAGAADLSLDLSGLAPMQGSDVDKGEDRLYIEDGSETPNRRQINPFELMQGLMRSVDSAMNPDRIQGDDRFQLLDVSFDRGIPRYFTWGSMRGLFLTDATLNVADPTMESTIASASRQSVAESLAAIAESQLVVDNDPVDNYVMAWSTALGTMVWRAESSTPVQTHNRYLALGDDATFVEADYTAGTTFTTDSFTFPTFTTAQFPAVAVPASAPITTFTQLGAFNQDITHLFTQGADLVIAGENHNIWIGIQAFPTNFSGIVVRLS